MYKVTIYGFYKSEPIIEFKADYFDFRRNVAFFLNTKEGKTLNFDNVTVEIVHPNYCEFVGTLRDTKELKFIHVYLEDK